MKIQFLPQNVICEFSGLPSVLEVALANQVTINHSCGGMGSCTTCLVRVKSDLSLLSARNELESEHAVARDFLENERLACQTTAIEGLIIEIPKSS